MVLHQRDVPRTAQEYNMAEASSSKRRRIGRSGNKITNILRNLPNEALSHVASYLPRPSMAMFAVAVRTSGQGRAILGSGQFDVLDFGEIEESLALKLTDEDVKSILICIDANTKLRKLKLAGCINITGAGLDPLRGSIVLEQIDLSLVAEHEIPELDGSQSCEQVVRILDGIIERDDNTALRSIVFPKCWRYEGNTVLNEFMGRCNDMFGRRNIRCTKCDTLVEENASPLFLLEGIHCGVQNFTCCSCTKHFCNDCEDENGADHFESDCKICEKSYCKGCATMDTCSECYESSCKKCQEKTGLKGMECEQCSKYYCRPCIPFWARSWGADGSFRCARCSR